MIDVSDSTLKASGSDIDRDGVIGRRPRERAAAPGLLPARGRLHRPAGHRAPRRGTRGARPCSRASTRGACASASSLRGRGRPDTGKRKRIDQQDAWLEVPLTDDYAAVHRALTAVLARGPNGATNFAAGIRLADGRARRPRRAEHRAPARSECAVPDRRHARRSRSGTATREDPGDVEAAVRAARASRARPASWSTPTRSGTTRAPLPARGDGDRAVHAGTYTPGAESGRCRWRSSRARPSRTSRTSCSRT